MEMVEDGRAQTNEIVHVPSSSHLNNVHPESDVETGHETNSRWGKIKSVKSWCRTTIA